MKVSISSAAATVLSLSPGGDLVIAFTTEIDLGSVDHIPPKGPEDADGSGRHVLVEDPRFMSPE